MEVYHILKKITLLTIILAATAQNALFGMRFKRWAALGKCAFTSMAVRSTTFKFKQDEHEQEEPPKRYGTLTIDEAAHKLYDKSMTDEELRDLCVGLLQDRINHWYELLESATTEEERKQVPMYIRGHQNPKITAEQMIDECKLLSDFDIYMKSIGKVDQLSFWYNYLLFYCGLRGTAGFAITKQREHEDSAIAQVASIYINRDISGFLTSQIHTILHELVHAEQLQNAQILYGLVGQEKMPTDPNTGNPIILLSHYWAQQRAENGDFDAESNNKLCETEADTIPSMTNFNPLLLQNLPRHLDHGSRGLALGYLSTRKQIEIAEEYATKYYEKYPHRKAHDQKQLEYWQKNFPDRVDYKSLITALATITVVLGVPMSIVLKLILSSMLAAKDDNATEYPSTATTAH